MSGKKRILITGSTNAAPGNDTMNRVWFALYDVLDELGLGLADIAVVHLGQKGVDAATVAACRNNNVTHIPVTRRDGESPRAWRLRALHADIAYCLYFRTPVKSAPSATDVVALAHGMEIPTREIPIPKKGA